MNKRFDSNMVVFLDFDNTISRTDILDDMLARFSKDARWEDLEKKWERGEIGSKECLKGQVEGIRITKDRLDKYLLTVQIDPYFKKLLDFLNSRNVRAVIVSDNFDYILERILKNNGISGLEIYSNRVNISGDRLEPVFPLSNTECGECAHCKKTTMLKKLGKDEVSVYVGDGRSDLCAAREAGVVFAKDYLKNYFTEKNLPHVPIQNLRDVYDYFRGSAS